ncbi:MAG: cobyric acid synthase [Clostridia bacterium]|nr:MAG: cobyric acid synthase [Clostridia bacterium]
MARAIMFQGTSSHVGKSVLVAALGRLLHRDGYRVAPFKAQNMALNAFVTADGGEIGWAQAMQAQACGLKPRVEMNPILLKPSGSSASQVIVKGHPIGTLSASAYHRQHNLSFWPAVEDCWQRLSQEFEIIVIEGAGSPAEVNLADRDIANMRTARLANSPVILVADIDRGGALASLVGTLELLPPEDAARVCGFILNKFRGDKELLQPALAFLEERTGRPVLGVIPYLDALGLPEEDSVSLEETRNRNSPGSGEVHVVVINLPRIANFSDFQSLAEEEDVALDYARHPAELGTPDAIILPGSKNTLEDLAWLQTTGMAAAIASRYREGTPVVGICGGYQMLGQSLKDPAGVESPAGEARGLGLLPVETIFHPAKSTRQVTAKVAAGGIFFAGLQGSPVQGYEIHHGHTRLLDGCHPAFSLEGAGEGAVSADGRCWGTYLHGLFDNDAFRRHFLNVLRQRRGLAPKAGPALSLAARREQAFDRWAWWVRDNVEIERIYHLLGI